MTSVGQHWHGYGPWIGGHQTFERSNEGRRRPSERSFLQSAEPPVEIGHYLLRRAQTRRELGWNDADAAMKWMVHMYTTHPPDSRLSYEPLESKIEYSRAALLGGADAYWQYSLSSERAFAVAVIGCPHANQRGTPCPLPLD
jgi:hypothetical protein